MIDDALISDELLAAYIDGNVTVEEREYIDSLCEDCEELRETINMVESAETYFESETAPVTWNDWDGDSVVGSTDGMNDEVRPNVFDDHSCIGEIEHMDVPDDETLSILDSIDNDEINNDEYVQLP